MQERSLTPPKHQIFARRGRSILMMIDAQIILFGLAFAGVRCVRMGVRCFSVWIKWFRRHSLPRKKDFVHVVIVRVRGSSAMFDYDYILVLVFFFSCMKCEINTIVCAVWAVNVINLTDYFYWLILIVCYCLIYLFGSIVSFRSLRSPSLMRCHDRDMPVCCRAHSSSHTLSRNTNWRNWRTDNGITSSASTSNQRDGWCLRVIFVNMFTSVWFWCVVSTYYFRLCVCVCVAAPLLIYIDDFIRQLPWQRKHTPLFLVCVIVDVCA